MLTRSDRINLKVRHRENSLKLKRLLERTDDGVERWRTEFDAPLPAGPERFRDVLDLIGRAGSAERLGAAAGAGEVVEILEASCDPSQLVAVHKSRHLFERGTCRVDEVRFRTRGGTYRSLGVESSHLGDLRSLVQDLGQGRLGSPCNYTESSRSIADNATGTATALGSARMPVDLACGSRRPRHGWNPSRRFRPCRRRRRLSPNARP